MDVQKVAVANGSRPRVRWFATFALLSAVGANWAIANPLFAPPDEASHTIRAAAVARGQIVGSALSSRQANDLTWGIGGRQGRHGLPFTVGVPIVAGMLIERSSMQGFFDRRRILLVLGAMIVVAQTFAFWQMLGRYSAGATGPLAFWVQPQWTPPLPTLFLVVTFPLAMIALVWWTLLRGAPSVGHAARPDQFQTRGTMELQEQRNGSIPADIPGIGDRRESSRPRMTGAGP